MATISALLIPADPKIPISKIDLQLEFFSETEWSALSAMYPHISDRCNCVERVQVGPKRPTPGAEYMFLWVDECGRMYDDSVINPRASELYDYELYGNAILCADAGGNSISLPEHMSTEEFIKDLDARLSSPRHGVFVYNPEVDRFVD